jgi:hypothetical protein
MVRMSRAVLDFVFGEPMPQAAPCAEPQDSEAAWQDWQRSAANEASASQPDNAQPPQPPQTPR